MGKGVDFQKKIVRTFTGQILRKITTTKGKRHPINDENFPSRFIYFLGMCSWSDERFIDTAKTYQQNFRLKHVANTPADYQARP